MTNDPLFQAVKQHVRVLQDYYFLGLKPNLDRQEEERIDHILQLAQDDELLNSLLIEIDDIIAQKQGLTNEESYKEYKDELSWMREYLIQEDFAQQQAHDKERCKKVQALLGELGFYSGPQDGLIGDKTLEAIKRFQSQENLEMDGVPGNDTLAKLRKCLHSRGNSHD